MECGHTDTGLWPGNLHLLLVTPVAKNYEYEVWMVQEDRVTFVNGRWRGSGNPAKMQKQDVATALQSCPLMWDLLNEKGRQGWELVDVVAIRSDDANGAKAYLKRARDA
jgi:hypothetical protein